VKRKKRKPRKIPRSQSRLVSHPPRQARARARPLARGFAKQARGLARGFAKQARGLARSRARPRARPWARGFLSLHRKWACPRPR